jgi:indole-3-glycerol phosphate synthase
VSGLSSILERILATKAEELRQRSAATPLAELAAAVASMPECRGFEAALLAAKKQNRPAVIAEIKKASPSRAVIRADFHPAEIARSYEENGATCLSVLTDQEYFQGNREYMVQARVACQLPVLRKDFIVEPWQVYESRHLGADAILLIVAALEEARLNDLAGVAAELGLDVLIEVHNEQELQSGLKTGAMLIGINNRNLHEFTTDLATSESLVEQVPGDRLVITESGIHTQGDVHRMQCAGINAFLVGEAFMRAENPGLALRELFFAAD